ncbi:hypothetical protein B1R94_02420 [Mycolicibacterium litorale]|nr:hypothetical protein B1R94_02420 [Mycolicibacterium litorale]
MPTWSPAEWGQFNIVGVVIIFGAFFLVAVSRGWLVPGNFHREFVASKDRELDAKERELASANQRADVQAETIQIQAKTLASKDAVEEATTQLMRALRDGQEQRAGQ